MTTHYCRSCGCPIEGTPRAEDSHTHPYCLACWASPDGGDWEPVQMSGGLRFLVTLLVGAALGAAGAVMAMRGVKQ